MCAPIVLVVDRELRPRTFRPRFSQRDYQSRRRQNYNVKLTPDIVSTDVERSSINDQAPSIHPSAASSSLIKISLLDVSRTTP